MTNNKYSTNLIPCAYVFDFNVHLFYNVVSGYGLLPVLCQTISWTNGYSRSVGPLGTSLSEIWIQSFHIRKYISQCLLQNISKFACWTISIEWHQHPWFWLCGHDDVIKWKHLPRYWPFVRRIHRSPVNSPHRGQWRGASMFSLICALNKRLSKQSLGWWFDTPSHSLWRHYNN